MADDVKSKTSQDLQQQIVIPNGDSKKATTDDNVADVGAESDAVIVADACVNGLNVVNSIATINNIAIGSRPSSNQPSDDDDDDAVGDGIQTNVVQMENGYAANNSSNSSCFSSTSSSTVSSRLSTPPPTGEDDSTPVSPSKTLQAKLVAANLNALSLGKTTIVQKQRCTCMQVRKTSSLKAHRK